MATVPRSGSASSSSTRPSNDSEFQVVCRSHGVGEMYVSQTHSNPFRRFVHCPERKVCGCDFFEWVDDEMPPHYLASVQRLKMQMESVEGRLQCKSLLTEVLYEKIRVRDAELQSLRCAKVPAEQTVEYAQRKPWAFAVVAAGVMLFITVMLKDVSFA